MNLSFPKTMLHHTILLLVNYKLESIWKEVVVAKYKSLSWCILSPRRFWNTTEYIGSE
jgi:hypothetical protein